MATTYLNRADLLRRSMLVADILRWEQEGQLRAERQQAHRAQIEAEFASDVEYMLQYAMDNDYSSKVWTPDSIAKETLRLTKALRKQDDAEAAFDASCAQARYMAEEASDQKWWSQTCAHQHMVNAAITRDQKKVKVAAVLSKMNRIADMDLESDNSDNSDNLESFEPSKRHSVAYEDLSDHEDAWCVKASKAPKAPKVSMVPKAPKHVAKPRKVCKY